MFELNGDKSTVQPGCRRTINLKLTNEATRLRKGYGGLTF